MRRLVLLVSAIVLVDTTFYAVVAPLLPTYADELGLGKGAAGLLSAAYPLGTLLGAVPCGALAARIGPRRTVLLGLGLLGGASLVFGFAQHVVLLDAARFVQGIGGACSWAGGLSWLLSSAPKDQRGALIGTAMSAAIAGSLLGPAVGALAEATSREAVFGSVLLITAALAAWALRTEPPPWTPAQRLGQVVVAVRRPEVRAGMWLVALPGLAFGVMNVVGSLRLDGFGASTAAVAVVFLIAAGGEGIVSPWVGRISDRRGRFAPIRVGLVAAAAVTVLVTLPGSVVGLAAVLILLGAVLGSFWAPAMALLADESERAGLDMGYAFGLVNLAWAVGQTVGSSTSGALADATTDAVPFALVGLVCVVTRVTLVRERPQQPPAETVVAPPVAAG